VNKSISVVVFLFVF